MNAICPKCRDPARLFLDPDDAQGYGYCSRCWKVISGRVPDSWVPVGKGLTPGEAKITEGTELRKLGHHPAMNWGKTDLTEKNTEQTTHEIENTYHQLDNPETMSYANTYEQPGQIPDYSQNVWTEQPPPPPQRKVMGMIVGTFQLRLDAIFSSIIALIIFISLVMKWIPGTTLADLKDESTSRGKLAIATSIFLSFLYTNYIIFVLFRSVGRFLYKAYTPGVCGTFHDMVNVILYPVLLWSFVSFFLSWITLYDLPVKEFHGGFWLALVGALLTPVHVMVRRRFSPIVRGF